MALDLQSPVKLDSQHKTLGNGFGLSISPKANSFRPPGDHPNEPKGHLNGNLAGPKTRKITNSEVIMIRAPSMTLKSQNSPTSQRAFMRVPISDLYNKEPENKIKKKGSTLCNFEENSPLGQQTDEPIEEDSQFHKYEEKKHDQSIKYNPKMLTHCSTMESSTAMHKTKVNSSNNLNITSSPPEKKKKNLEANKTLKDFGFQNLHSPKGEQQSSSYRKRIKVRQLSITGEAHVAVKPPSSKTHNKFTDAFQKAKVYNDQVILQYQFDKQNEEEERDFCELYEMLQTNM